MHCEQPSHMAGHLMVLRHRAFDKFNLILYCVLGRFVLRQQALSWGPLRAN